MNAKGPLVFRLELHCIRPDGSEVSTVVQTVSMNKAEWDELKLKLPMIPTMEKDVVKAVVAGIGEKLKRIVCKEIRRKQ